MNAIGALGWAATVVLGATTAIAGLVQPAAAAPSFAPVYDYTGPIYNTHTVNEKQPKVMTVLNASTADSTPMIQYSYSSASGNNERMVLEYESSAAAGTLRIKPLSTLSNDGNVHNDKCLAVKNNTAGNNVPILNAACTYDSVNNDVWIAKIPYVNGSIITGVYWFQNQSTGKCITTQNASLADNAALITFDCNGGENGMWEKQ